MRIGIDIDDTIAQFIPYFIKRYNEKYGTEFNVEDIKSFCLEEELDTIRRRIDDEVFGMQVKGEYWKLECYPDVAECISHLKDDGNEIILITSRVCASDTVEWLKRYGIEYDELYTIKSKQYILGALNLDFFIDDSLENIKYAEYFGIKPILFNQPWNSDCDRKNVKRVFNWEDIYNYVEEEQFG